MTLYEFLLFIHATASIVWIGAGFLSLVLATTYDRESDEAAITRFCTTRSGWPCGCSCLRR